MNDWRDRDRGGNDRWRDESGRDERWQGSDRSDEYQRRRQGYGEAREHWRNSEPRYGERNRGERASEYSSIPGLGTNYGGGGWLNEYGNDSRHHGERSASRGEPWRRDEESWQRSRYSGEHQDPYRRNYGRGLDVGDDEPRGYGRGYGPRDDQRYGQGGDHDRGWWDRTKDEVRSWMGDEEAERRRAADHTGRGPKGYTRTDERIRDDVSDRLMESWEVDATDIEVAVAGAEVTLTGTVGDRQSKRRAEIIAANVLGVKDVQNSLRVRRIDPFATGREAASMNQGTGSNPTTGGTTTGTPTTGAASGTATSPTSARPRH